MGISRNTPYSRVLGGVVTLLSVAAIGAPARAVVINVGGVNWDISAEVVSPDPTEFDFNLFTATFIIDQPWAGDEHIANDFAAALGARLGLDNPSNYGPYFAFDAVGTGPVFDVGVSASPDGSGALAFTVSSDRAFFYAKATRAPRSVVPGPLPVLGGMAAFGWSRRLRRRVSLVTRP
jgi:hypothetical protein